MPIEESKKHLSCEYLGCTYVGKPAGMDVLRPAIVQVSTSVPKEKWIPVTVNISPTSIIIASDDVRKSKLFVSQLIDRSLIFVGRERTITRMSSSISLVSWCWTEYQVDRFSRSFASLIVTNSI